MRLYLATAIFSLLGLFYIYILKQEIKQVKRDLNTCKQEKKTTNFTTKWETKISDFDTELKRYKTPNKERQDGYFDDTFN